MKTTTLLTLLAIVVSMETNAQNLNAAANQVSSVKSAATITPTGLGKMIAGFSDKISPSAFTPGFLKNKKAWTDKANNVNDAKGSGTLLKELEAGLNSSAFTSTWAKVKGDWLVKASTIKSPKDIQEALQSLRDNLKPDMLKKL